MKKGRFSPLEERFIKNNYLMIDREELALKLNRDDDSLRHKMKAMGIGKESNSSIIHTPAISFEKRREKENAGRVRLLNFINSEYTDKNYNHVSIAFIDIARYEILNRYRKNSA